MREAVLTRPSTASSARARPARGGWLAVVRLDLTDFRSYRRLRLALDGGPVVLAGPNGAGKTNLLEAVSFLVPGRGLRGARLAEVRFRPPGGAPLPALPGGVAWAVAASVDTPDGRVELGTGVEVVAEGEPEAGERLAERRVVRVNGARAGGQAALAESVSAVWITPAMDRLFLDAPGARRRFLDRLVGALDPGHAGRLAAYEGALRQRQRLLREGREAGRPADGDWLSALEETMAANGVAVAAARVDAVDRLNRAATSAAGAFPAASLSLAGEIEAGLEAMPALAAEERFRDALRAGRARDAEAGTALAGPQRSDLKVVHLERGEPAAACSTGEQKALLVSIVLANARLRALERGVTPILLLDEIAAHLDRRRLAALFDELVALGAQAWLSGTEIATFAPLDGAAQFFAVRDSTLTPEAQAASPG
ncbi:MAG: DNA replication/repair protein RecF [Proteobacteria bacterium]|nr:DNA replication/repair protein RecF [Pseudomonadota bacterium]